MRLSYPASPFLLRSHVDRASLGRISSLEIQPRLCALPSSVFKNSWKYSTTFLQTSCEPYQSPNTPSNSYVTHRVSVGGWGRRRL